MRRIGLLNRSSLLELLGTISKTGRNNRRLTASSDEGQRGLHVAARHMVRKLVRSKPIKALASNGPSPASQSNALYSEA